MPTMLAMSGDAIEERNGPPVAHTRAAGRPVWRTAVASVLAICLGLGAGAAQGQSGSVVEGSTGSRTDVALADATRAAASEALGGRTIGIVVGTLPDDIPEAEGAKGAIEALGARAVTCQDLGVRRRQLRCGDGAVDALIVLQLFPGKPFSGPAEDVSERLLRRGVPIVVIDYSDAAEVPQGAAVIRIDDMAIGLAQGRAAGAWIASAWPDEDVTVAIRPSGEGTDPLYEGAAQGLAETAPTATILPPSLDPLDAVEANLLTGWVRMEEVTPLLAAGALGIEGGPFAIFPISCPEPLPTMSEFAGCLRYGNEEVGIAAVDTLARLAAGEQVPATVLAGPTIEVVTPG